MAIQTFLLFVILPITIFVLLLQKLPTAQTSIWKTKTVTKGTNMLYAVVAVDDYSFVLLGTKIF